MNAEAFSGRRLLNAVFYLFTTLLFHCILVFGNFSVDFVLLHLVF